MCAVEERERRTGSCQGFSEVRKVDICGEVCLAGPFEWVGKSVTLERLYAYICTGSD
jgi:hypothetical protein